MTTAASPSTPILDIWVLGTPRPKGSLRFVTRTYAKEQNETSPAWRGRVAAAAHSARRCSCTTACDCGQPYRAAVRVDIDLQFVPPKKRQPSPSTRTTGDADKHARNILDALEDAAVFRDDAQVVDLRVNKRYTTGAAGAHITVWPVPDTTDDRQQAGEPPSRKDTHMNDETQPAADDVEETGETTGEVPGDDADDASDEEPTGDDA